MTSNRQGQIVTRGLISLGSVVALTAAIGVHGSASTSASSGEDFLVAIRTSDAILPIARYANGTWGTVWAESDGDVDSPLPTIVDVPVGWLGQPLPSRWTTQFNPRGRDVVAVTGLERSSCHGPAYILVNAIRQASPGAVDTMHVGLATAPARTTLPIVRESTNQPLTSIRAAATRAALTLGGSKPVLRWLLRAGDRRDVFFFETRETPPNGSYDDGIVGGWIRVRPTGAKPLYTWKNVCGNEEAATLPCVIPIGVIPFADHDIWVLERPMGETGAFELWRLDDHDARSILASDAGGC